jgi:hypothetical protein
MPSLDAAASGDMPAVSRAHLRISGFTDGMAILAHLLWTEEYYKLGL